LKTTRMQLDGLSKRVVDATGGAGHSFVEVKDGIQAQSGVAARTFDAVGQMSEGLLSASREIERMTGRIQDSAVQVAEMERAIGQVAETIGGLKAILEEASEATKKGDQNVRILARDVADLSAQVNTANLALTNMASGAERAQSDGSDAASIMGNLREETERIGAAIEATIEGSDAIHLSNERILEVTASLQSRVDRVDDVLEAVHSLAERTKLLSINASIIASEAGEHGRAFAVVAREVKELAQSTATAISEISVVLVGLKEGFGQTIKTIQRGQTDVDKGIRMARNAVVLLKSIPAKVHQAAELTSAIAKRNAAQKAEGYEVKRIVEKVSETMKLVGELLAEQVSRNNHTLQLFGTITLTAEQVLGSASDHAAASSEVNRSVEIISGDFRGLAEQVRSNVSGLNTIVHLAEEVLTITDSNRRRTEEVTSLISELNRYALDLGKDAERPV
jgi:methyl-accepting chemotaxis protein